MELVGSGIMRSEEAWMKNTKTRDTLEKANSDNSYKDRHPYDPLPKRTAVGKGMRSNDVFKMGEDNPAQHHLCAHGTDP